MLPNGLMLTIDLALGSMPPSRLHVHRPALILGSLREDMAYIPLWRTVVASLSLSHFCGARLPGGFFPFLWPGPRSRGRRLFEQAVAAYHGGELAKAMVLLGRVAHLVADLACPVHVHRVLHETDPFEWYVETHREALLARPLPAVPTAGSVAEILKALAAQTRCHAADKTHSLWGRWMKRLGWRRSVPVSELGPQAEVLLPRAGAAARALFELFLARTEERPSAT